MRHLLSCVLAVLLSISVSAQIPRMMAYQGRLFSPGGEPFNGETAITVGLTDVVGALVWEEAHPSVSVVDGVFEILIGSVTPLNIAFDMPYLLRLEVGDTTLEPSTYVAAAPYALNAERLGGVNRDGYLRRDLAQVTTVNAAGDALRVENTGGGRGLTVVSAAQHGVYGKSMSAQAAVEGEGAGSGAGLRGYSVANHGAIGYTTASNKAGVFGNSPNGTGVWGNSDNGDGVYGHSATDRGVFGHTVAADPSMPAVYGHSEGQGDGVAGRSDHRHGVSGVSSSSSTSHAGVYATNDGYGPAILADGYVQISNGSLSVYDGDLHLHGAFRGNVGVDGAPYPRPAFDSGWINATAGASFTLGVGLTLPTSHYSNENFVVDLMTRTHGLAGSKSVGIWDSSSGIAQRGVYYLIETDNDIHVSVGDDEGLVSQVRVRVWYYR